MSSSDDFQRGPHESHIADTGTFQRFVDKGAQPDQVEPAGDSSRIWMVLLGIVVIIAAGLVVWTLTR